MLALDRPPERRRSWKRLLALQLVIWPLALILGELGLRGFRAAFGEGYSAERVRGQLQQLERRNREFVPRPNDDLPWTPVESERAERVLQPYVGYDIVGGLDLLEDQLADAKATPQIPTFRIAVFGGSVAQIFAQEAEQHLRRALGATPRLQGVDVRILSFARGGFRQPQLQAFLAYLLGLGIRPDAVLCLDGFNEVAIGRQNAGLGTHVSYPSVAHWAQLVARGSDDEAAIAIAARVRDAQTELARFTSWALEHDLARSAILGELALRRAQSLRRRSLRGFAEYTDRLRASQSRRAIAGPALPDDRADPVPAAVALWREASFNMRALCEARGIPYLHVLQPTLHDSGAKPIHPDEARDGAIDAEWLEGVQVGYPLLRAAGAELAERGEHFFDASRIFASVEEPLYFDNCHLNARGNELLAKAIGKRLREVLE